MARERDYELGIVINPEAGDDQTRATVERITNVITNNGGEVFRVNAWGRRRLAYPIERHRDGLYFFFDIKMPAQSVVEVERAIRVNEEIIRHLMKLREAKFATEDRKRAEEADARAAAEAQARAEAEARASEEAATRAAKAPTAEATAESEGATETGATGEQAEAPASEEAPATATTPTTETAEPISAVSDVEAES